MQNLRTKLQLSSTLLRAIHQNTRRETYYDILQLSRDCTNKEVKEAFVRLSKKYHPDTKGAKADPKQTAAFVKISEAYQVLSKPHSRRDYDRRLHSQVAYGDESHGGGGFHTTEMHRPWDVRPNYSANPGPYYGIHGLGKVSNFQVALAMIALGILGAVVGFFSVKQSFSYNRRKLDERSAEAGAHHASVRANAEKFGNEEQIRRLVGRLLKQDEE